MNKHLTWKTIRDFSRRYFDKDVPTTTPLKKKEKKKEDDIVLF